MLALGGAAGVGSGGVFGGFVSDTGGLVVGVAHAGSGEARQPGVEVGAQFRGGDQFPDAHAVAALGAPGEATLTCPVGIGEPAVRVDQQGAAVCRLFQLVGTQLQGLVGQQLLGARNDLRRGVLR